MKGRDKTFLWNALFLSPFGVLLFELLLLSANCAQLSVAPDGFPLPTWQGFLCYGYPHFLQHSLYYDFLFLRASFVEGAEHWASALSLALAPYLVFAITRNGRFAFWTAIFSAMWHEVSWLGLEWAWNGRVQSQSAFFASVYYLAVIFLVSAFVIRRYRQVFWNWRFVMITGTYIAFLMCWALFDNMNVTVGGAFSQPILTAWYWDPLTNFFEVGSWVFAEALMVWLVWMRRVEARKFEK